jgi:hypothetical protein
MTQAGGRGLTLGVRWAVGVAARAFCGLRARRGDRESGGLAFLICAERCQDVAVRQTNGEVRAVVIARFSV